MDDWPEQRYWKPQATRLLGKRYAVSFFGSRMSVGHAAVEIYGGSCGRHAPFSEAVTV